MEVVLKVRYKSCAATLATTLPSKRCIVRCAKRGVVLAVGHHNNRSTLFIQFCQQIHHLSSVLGVQVTGSSSASISLGLVTTARAIATRCC